MPVHPSEEHCLIWDEEYQTEIANVAPADQFTYGKAMKSAEAPRWKVAMREEFDSLEEFKTAELVPPPQDGTPVARGLWRLLRKRDEHGNIARFKGRWVLDGRSQKQGVNFFNTHADVAHLDSVRAVLAQTAANQWDLEQFDIGNAFLNADIDCTVYTQQVQGFEVPGKEHWVWKLRRALYGTKQAPRLWKARLKRWFLDHGFTVCSADACVFILRRDNMVLIVPVHIDDGLTAGHKALIDWLRAELEKEFKVKWNTRPTLHLGMRIEYHKETGVLYLDQRHYIRELLERFGLQNAPTESTPATTKPLEEATEEDIAAASSEPYQGIVGCLMWLAICTRPEISQAVGELSRFLTRPGTQHIAAAKRVLRYLRGTMEQRLCYRKESHWRICAQSGKFFSDANWAGCPVTRRSTTGYVFLVSNGPVSWKSRRQPTVALSSTEAEYMALSEATRHAIWLKRLLADLGAPVVDPMVILGDNQGALFLARDPVHHQRTKHIDIRYHFIRERIEKGEVDVKYVPTVNMIADVLTKPLGRDAHRTACRGLGLVEHP